jgi:hypothetical protein
MAQATPTKSAQLETKTAMDDDQILKIAAPKSYFANLQPIDEFDANGKLVVASDFDVVQAKKAKEPEAQVQVLPPGAAAAPPKVALLAPRGPLASTKKSNEEKKGDGKKARNKSAKEQKGDSKEDKEGEGKKEDGKVYYNFVNKKEPQTSYVLITTCFGVVNFDDLQYGNWNAMKHLKSDKTQKLTWMFKQMAVRKVFGAK